MKRIFTWFIFAGAIVCLSTTIAVALVGRAYSGLELQRTLAGLARLQHVQQIIAKAQQSNPTNGAPAVQVRQAPASTLQVGEGHDLPRWAAWYGPRQPILNRVSIAAFWIGTVFAVTGVVRRLREAYSNIPDSTGDHAAGG